VTAPTPVIEVVRVGVQGVPLSPAGFPPTPQLLSGWSTSDQT